MLVLKTIYPRFLPLKLLLLFSVLALYSKLLFATNVKDRAYVRVGDNIYFDSETNLILKDLAYTDCLFGGSVFEKFFSNKRDKVKTYIQLKNYLTERKFIINEKDYMSLTRSLNYENCKESKDKRSIGTLDKSLFLVEIFLQEQLNGVKQTTSKKIIKNLVKILDVKYPVFFYEI